MSTWMAGAITFKGAQEDLEKLYAALTPEGELSMNGISPVPDGLAPDDSPYLEAAVYAWAKDHPFSERNMDMFKALRGTDSWDNLLKRGESRIASCGAKKKVDFIRLGRQSVININKYKCATEMDWRIRYWGIAWDLWPEDGGCELKPPAAGSMDLMLRTPWDFPFPFLETLGKKFPAISFTGIFASDEDNESCRGRVSCSGGDLKIDEEPDDLWIYNALWGDKRQNIKI